MPSQQRFEGPDLEGLLDEVRGRFGSDVAIVEANKLRAGGIGGFFARELFEVVVEVDDDAPPAEVRDASGGSVRPRTLLDLVDAVDDGPMPERPISSGIATARSDVPRARDVDTAPLTPSAPTVSTDGDAFAAVLERIARATEAPAPSPTDHDEPFRSFAEAAAAPAPRPAAPIDPADLPAAPPARRHRAPSSQTPAPLERRALRRLGLPPSLLERAPASLDRVSALIELAERFPRAERLPTTGDTVIALVGDRRGMELAVAWVHAELGLVPERLMLASQSDRGVFPTSRRIADQGQAASRRRSWRRAAQPMLVVVDEPVVSRGTGWARHVLDALEPAAVWGVVDAQRKPEDVVAWATRIGGVDAIALDGTADTSSPASALATGVPVSLIDGHRATPARWAALLDERLRAA